MTPANGLRLVIDTDTGTDDAVAIVMALQAPGVHVEALTAVSGNVEVDQCVRNARYVLELCGASVPVYRGADHPLVRPLRTAAHVHGGDGLGDIGLRPGSGEATPGVAAEALVDLIHRNPGEITLVALAPLTNIALALALAPDIAGMVAQTVIMGGAANTVGNVTPAAEFNIWCDPEAARVVFRSGMPLTMVGIELCRGVYAHSTADQLTLAALGTARAEFVCAMCRAGASRVKRRSDAGQAGLPDAVAMAIALDRSLLTGVERWYVDVETAGELTSGETVVDRLGVLGMQPNVDVATSIDAVRYKEMVRASCSEHRD